MFLSRPKEDITHHTELCFKYFNKLNVKVLDNIIKAISNNDNMIYGMCTDSIILHDYGKRNPYFQYYIGNDLFSDYKLKSLKDKEHSLCSAIYFISYTMDKLDIKVPLGKCRGKIRLQQLQSLDFMISFAYNIKKHHSSIGDLNKNLFVKDIYNYYITNTDKFENIDVNIENLEYLKTFNFSNVKHKNEYKYYMLFKLHYGMLVLCDFLAVYEFENNKEFEFNRISNQKQEFYLKNLYENDIIKNIKNYKIIKENMSEVNRYRSEMFIESEEILLKNKHNNLFYLESPTGSGKTLTSMNLALKLSSDYNDKIIYVSTLNNIGEQTNNVFKDVLKGDYNDIVAINSKSEIVSNNKNVDEDYLNFETLNYNISTISHVKLFDCLFGTKRADNLMLPLLCNSVIILDEIQGYRNLRWKEIINSLKEFAEILNLKIIIMSATLPKMDKLLEEDYEIVNLIKNRNYYYDYFKTRCEYNYSLLKYKRDNENILNNIRSVIEKSKYKRILIETLTIKTCEDFYDNLREFEKEGFLIFKITAITNKVTRKYIIDTIQKKDKNGYINNKVILIGTQAIEAGIDIDMDVGFKDISILDSDEQFCGRVGRNFKRRGVVYFYDLDDSNFIYKDDYRKERNLHNKEWREIFESKDYEKFYDRNFKWLLDFNKNDYIEYKNKLGNLNYKKIQQHMELIDTETYNFLFLLDYKEDDKIINCKDILNTYLHIKSSYNHKYSETKIKQRHIEQQLDKFTYGINAYNFKNTPNFDMVNGYYIIPNGLRYFENIESNKYISESTQFNAKDFITDINLFI